jgi:hypothetical protein
VKKKLQELDAEAGRLMEMVLDMRATIVELSELIPDDAKGLTPCFVPGCRVGGRGRAVFYGLMHPNLRPDEPMEEIRLPCCRAHLGSDRALYEIVKKSGRQDIEVTFDYPDPETGGFAPPSIYLSETKKRGER